MNKMEPPCIPFSSLICKYTNLWMFSNWRTKRPIVSAKNKHFYLLFSINKLNYSKAKKNEKSGNTLYGKSNKNYVCIYIYIYLYIYIHTYIYIYIYIHINTHVYTNIHTYIHIYTQTYTHQVKRWNKLNIVYSFYWCSFKLLN